MTAVQADRIRSLLAQGPATSRHLIDFIDISQPTLSRAIAGMGTEIVRIGAARSIQYALRDTTRGFAEVPVYRISAEGQIRRLGMLLPVRPDGFVLLQDDGTSLHSDGLPWWVQDMRPAGFLGRAFAISFAAELGLPVVVQQVQPTLQLRAVLRQALTNDFVSTGFELGRRLLGRWCWISHMECRRFVGLEFFTADESSAFHITSSQPLR